MSIKSIIGTTCACLAVVSFNASAAFISYDLHNAGDGVITRDTNTGLEWLDLTVTAGQTRAEVNAKLASGGIYESWRRATNDEVVDIWQAFGMNLSPGTSTYATGFNDNLYNITSYLGNLDTGASYNSTDIHDILMGVTDATSTNGYLYLVGAFHQSYTSLDSGQVFDPETFYKPLHYELYSNNDTSAFVGSYLVRESAISTVPVPAAVWLFGSGLIGLIGIARRKKA